MKRFYRIIGLLITLVNTLPISAIESPTTYASTAKKYARTAQEKAMHLFNERLARFMRCFHGKCTKTETLKTAGDVGIAATIVIAGLYATGGALKKIAAVPWHSSYRKTVPRYRRKMEKFGKSLQKPAITAVKYIKTPYFKAQRLRYPYQKGDLIQIQDGNTETVDTYNPKTNKITFSRYDYLIDKKIPITVSAEEVELIETIEEKSR